MDGVELVSVPGVGPICELQEVQTQFGTPRTVAGEGVETDTNKCHLKPLRRLDYYPITFTDDQWQRLQAAFPAGVCDWSQPGVDQVGTVAWQTYRTRRGSRLRRPAVGPSPGGSGTGWTSTAFSAWRGG